MEYTELVRRSKQHKCCAPEPPTAQMFVSSGSSACIQPAVSSAIAEYFLESVKLVSELKNEGLVEILSTVAPIYNRLRWKTVHEKLQTKMANELSTPVCHTVQLKHVVQ